MRLGISPFASTREGVIRISEAAVDGGLDTLWLGDGYVAGDDFPGWAGGMESMTELAWLSGRFPSARVGVSAAVLPLRDPQWLAKEANTLDNLTSGGFVLVVTPGFWPRDFSHRGVDFDDRGTLFDERLGALVAALDGSSFDGVHTHVPAWGRLAPEPDTGGGVPVWLAGATATMRRALRLGMPYQASRATPDDLAPIAAEWFDNGGTVLAHRVRVQAGDVDATGNEVDWQAITGSADQLVDALERFRELGVSDLSMVPGQHERASLDTIEVLAVDVLPQLAG
ncbi:MAG: LLM class flavin-dependent oxidoreductase [Acidimicrobiia bacterium]|nr:LLM class flavin-dependent oxidoreductase [Acidimicrobiia bacterium]